MSGDLAEQPVSRAIDLATYPRRRLYEYFRAFDVPVNSRTMLFDVAPFKEHLAARKLRFFVSLSFLLCRAANEVPELRHRIEDETLVEFDRVFPAFTVLDRDNVLSFAKGVYSGRFKQDYAYNLDRIERASRGLDQSDEPERQGQLFITNVPWYSFTSIHHPYSRRTASIPIFSVGKAYEDGDRIMLPLGVQSNHALVDGYHIGRFVALFSAYCANPEAALGS